MLKKAILYPITKENEILLRYSSLLEQVKIIGGLLLDESIDESYSNAMVGLKEIDRYDTVIIGDGTILENSNEKKIIDLIYNVVNYKKDIIILYQLNQEQYDLICNVCKKNGVNFELISGLDVENCNYSKEIYVINTPIILVTGVNEHTDKFETQLLIRKFFIKRGYKVSQIGTKRFSNLFGMYAFPEFMYQNIQEQEKIIRFNRLCKSIEKKENPDVIIVGVPGGVIPINNEFVNRFGITAIEVGSAINVDIMILNLNYDDYTTNFFDDMRLMAKYKFNVESLLFNMTNHKIDFQRSKEDGILRFVTLEKIKVKDMVSKIEEINLYENDENGINKMCEEILEELDGSDIQLM